MNQAFWRKWHRWIGFVAVPFLLYAAVTGVCLAVNEFFGADEAQREALREVVSQTTLPPSQAAWSESLAKAFAAAAVKAPGAPVDKVTLEFKGEPPTVIVYTGKPDGGEDRKFIVHAQTGELLRVEDYVDKPFLVRLHSGEAWGDGGLVVAMCWGSSLVLIGITGIVIYFKMRRPNATGLKRIFWLVPLACTLSARPPAKAGPAELTQVERTIAVIVPQVSLKLEPVSARLKRELMHPDKTATLEGLRYSPDGRRIIAGSNPGGVIQVWDAATGEQLSKIESGHGYHGDMLYFSVSPDWKTVYVPWEKRQAAPVEGGGQQWVRWELDGGVRVWDLDTGKLRDPFRHDPPRGVYGLVLSPDGSNLTAFESLSGESDHGPRQVVGIWDLKTRQFRPVAQDPRTWGGVYAPNSKTLAFPCGDPAQPAGVRLIDVASAEERASVTAPDKGVRVGFIAFSPDSALLVGQVRDERDSGRHWLRLWDTATGQELCSLEGLKKDYFLRMAFSPDSRTLAAGTIGRTGPGRLSLFDLVGLRQVASIPLGEKAVVHQPVFSPDGRWLAVPTQVIPENVQDLRAEDVPQPRIHLIDVAAGVVRETLIAPQGFPVSACFSPDGKTLATSGHGRILLWDLTKPPGEK